MGPSGSGKTTLLDVLAGARSPPWLFSQSPAFMRLVCTRAACLVPVSRAECEYAPSRQWQQMQIAARVAAGRKTQGTIEGEVLFAGTKPTPNFLRRFTGCAGSMLQSHSASCARSVCCRVMAALMHTCGHCAGDVHACAALPPLAPNLMQRPRVANQWCRYVEQFDTLLDVLTVREMLLYTAELKRPVKEPQADKVKAVDAYIDKLSLESCKDTRIGSKLSRRAAHACVM
jgi:energy-coupling factor transporter ATP-binding protein EcfA2